MQQPVSKPQLTAIHSMFAAYAKRSLDVTNGDERASRLRFLSDVSGRAIGSARELTSAEAFDAIDKLKLMLGQQPKRMPRERLGRDAARAAGTHGRRGVGTNELAIAGEADLARVNEAITRLGWDEARFQSWLRSPHSPLKNTADPKIHTVAQANRVWWALKRMLKASGKWRAA